MPKVKLSYSPNYEAVSKNIKKMMAEKDITRKDMAKCSYINYSTLCYKLREKPQRFDIKELSYIAHTLNVNVADLLNGI